MRSVTSARSVPSQLMSNWISKVPCGNGGAAAIAGASAAALIRSEHKLRIIAFHAHPAILQHEPPLQKPAHRARIDDVLLREHSRGQRLGSVVRPHAHCRL